MRAGGMGSGSGRNNKGSKKHPRTREKSVSIKSCSQTTKSNEEVKNDTTVNTNFKLNLIFVINFLL